MKSKILAALAFLVSIGVLILNAMSGNNSKKAKQELDNTQKEDDELAAERQELDRKADVALKESEDHGKKAEELENADTEISDDWNLK